MVRAPPDERSVADLLAFGVVNLDKPPGPTSHQVAAWVRDMTRDAMAAVESPVDGPAPVDRAAHAGTLDPKVTGCLPVLTGTATRLSQALLAGAKEYVAVLELHDDPPADLDAVVGEFAAPLYQKPPRKSAVARELRIREVYDLDVLEVRDRKALLAVRCESGTYVRKLCHDLGLALGTGAHMGDLRRTATGPFDDSSLVTLHDLADALARWTRDGSAEWLADVVQPAERALTPLPSVTVAPSAAEEIAHGAQVYAPGVINVDGLESAGDGPTAGGSTDADDEPLVACYTPDGAAVCLGWLVGDPDAETGVVVELERVLV